MGTARDKGAPTRRFHSGADDKKRNWVRGRGPPPMLNTNQRDKTEKQPTLSDVLSKAGLILPYDNSLLGDSETDATLIAGLAKSAPRMSPKTLTRFFVLIFEEAIKLLQSEKMAAIGSNPIEFLKALQVIDGLNTWADSINDDDFISLFLVFRAARENWHHEPRHPTDQKRHCKLSHAVDAFNKIDTLDWNSDEVVERLLKLREREGLLAIKTLDARAAEKDEKDMTPFERDMFRALRRRAEKKLLEVNIVPDEEALNQVIKEKVAREAPYHLHKKREQDGTVEVGQGLDADVEMGDEDGAVRSCRADSLVASRLAYLEGLGRYLLAECKAG